jgi:hypothetical protein
MNDPVNTSHEISDLAETWGESHEISDATGFNSGYRFLEQHYILVLIITDCYVRITYLPTERIHLWTDH